MGQTRKKRLITRRRGTGRRWYDVPVYLRVALTVAATGFSGVFSYDYGSKVNDPLAKTIESNRAYERYKWLESEEKLKEYEKKLQAAGKELEAMSRAKDATK